MLRRSWPHSVFLSLSQYSGNDNECEVVTILAYSIRKIRNCGESLLAISIRPVFILHFLSTLWWVFSRPFIYTNEIFPFLAVYIPRHFPGFMFMVEYFQHCHPL